ncbi:Gfo/Idh/MocA family oxidoreductase [Clostridium septicum]|uniref:Gfo/Idh/MocA family oxidoreductase n=1 Tax=Clostridium septicum TaxID=1504 RepID=A0A9N7JMU6_CLOSE|nr:Gfo/Idh/MocA family oxidoreductase [Clostridium septicum]AYE35029.1 inositol 2-dehydrogenase [Clostridium septicum]QAS60423.1 inositol 2-dehydrogenase [Clostridium septicum]UEC20322.1 Gfo/Idh/MocA family oxidoreductase [Clostridium septicum]USS01626.1 Gfo/Idh/MocA family oxidoreductase [Clostridium septicum]WLF70197.1 Gfo/Idh/MocA family oxidoreductase [Clostridium septicum]
MKKINFGIVGVGRLGKAHAENLAFKIPNANLLAVCSIDKSQIDEVQKAWNIPYRYASFDEMLTNKELDAIFIASPSGFHCNQIKKALDAGFHVFSEKPLGLYLEDTIEAMKAVNSNSEKIFMLGFMRRYDKSYAYAKKKIKEGFIGKPVLVRCYGLDPAKALPSFLKFAKDSYSGGLFLDMAIHDIDLARWYLESEADELWAIGDAYEYEEFKEINDAETGSAMIKFKNGTMALLVAGRNCAHGYHIETEIIGTKGTLRIGTTPNKNLVTIFDERGVNKECAGGFLERFEDAYLEEVKEFVNCILENRKPNVTVEDGVLSTIVGYACKESFETGKLVKIDYSKYEDLK